MIFTPLPRLVGPTSAPPPLAVENIASMKHSSSSICPCSRSVGQIRQHFAQHFLLAPLLKAAVHRFVVRVGLRQHLPLRSVFESTTRFEHFASRNRFAASATLGDVFFRQVPPDALPLFDAQPNH